MNAWVPRGERGRFQTVGPPRSGAAESAKDGQWTASGRRFDCVFFDAAGTLFQTRDTVGSSYWRTLGAGGDADPELVTRLDEAFSKVFQQRQPLLFPAASESELPELERRWWWEVVQATFVEAGMEPPRRDAFQPVYDHFATGAAWRLEPGCALVLRELKRRGYRLGVISNFDSRLSNILRDLGLLGLFENVTISSLVRLAKPDPEIFFHALDALRTTPDQALHVGDNPEDDLNGAAAAGVSAVLYDPKGNGCSRGVRRIRELRELLDFLV